MENIIVEISSDAVSAVNAPWYPKLVAITIPVRRGPNVWPTSIAMQRKPIAVPMRFLGASSLMRAGVGAVAIAKPSPYNIDIKRSMLNCVVNGIASKNNPLIIEPVIIGVRLPI
jgi:hypothetical protein